MSADDVGAFSRAGWARRAGLTSLLAGRNHTTNSMGSITEAAAGFPNSSGHIPF